MFPQILLLTLWALFLSFSPVFAQTIVTDGHVQAQLIPATKSIQPGEPFWVSVRLKMDKGWHVYWKNPGDSGIPVNISWSLPEHFTAEPIQWPYPVKIDQPPLASYGYTNDVSFMARLTPYADINSRTATLKANVNWLVCQVDCIPGRATVTLDLPVTHETPEPDKTWLENFERTRFNLPLEKSNWIVTAVTSPESLTLNLHDIEKDKYPLSGAYFFPESDSLIRHAEKQAFHERAYGYELVIQRSALFAAPLTRLKGVLVSPTGWEGPRTRKALAIDIPVLALPSNETNPLPAQPPFQLTIMLGLAFLGGLILNLMPCVLPVLSLKVLGLIRHANDDRTKMWIHGLAFSSGVMIAFWVLAGVLIALRAAGQQIGWGFQFQSPLFLGALSILFLIFALNIFGLFEIHIPFQIPLSRTKSSIISDLLNGVLATITATPCTAPFMGTALGFSLTQTPLVSLAIFSALALGMASPYLLLTCFPGLLVFLPKPGLWMVQFKRFLGVLLLGTVVWLVWLLGIQTSVINHNDPTPANGTAQLAWQPYSEKMIQQLIAEKRPIFIDFTAKWCLTCQVNEKIALNDRRVIKRFQELNVAPVKADLTFDDAVITRALTARGRNSIPFYLLYGNDQAKDPLILPEILTPGIVLDALKKIDQQDHHK